MPPLVDFRIDLARLSSARGLGYNSFGATFIEISDSGIAVEGFVGQRSTKSYSVDQRSNPDGAKAIACSQLAACEIA